MTVREREVAAQVEAPLEPSPCRQLKHVAAPPLISSNAATARRVRREPVGIGPELLLRRCHVSLPAGARRPR